MKNFLSHVLLWTIRLIPVVLAGLAIWLPSFVPENWLVIIGWVALSGGGLAALVFFVAWTYASAMRS